MILEFPAATVDQLQSPSEVYSYNCNISKPTEEIQSVYRTKGVYREEGMQLTLFSESSDFVLSYF